VIRHEAYPGELDVCDVCGEVFADADRGLVHGCFRFKGLADGPFVNHLLVMALDDEKAGRQIGLFDVGAEFFNALEMELCPWRGHQSLDLVPIGKDGMPARDFNGPLVIGTGQRIYVNRALPIWAVQLHRFPRAAPPGFFGIDRSEDPVRLAGQRMDVRSVADILKRLYPQRRHPAYEQRYQGWTIVRGADVANFEPGESVRFANSGQYDIKAPGFIHVVADDGMPRDRVMLVSTSGPNRAQRRGRTPKDEATFNGTPRALRTTRKPWER